MNNAESDVVQGVSQTHCFLSSWNKWSLLALISRLPEESRIKEILQTHPVLLMTLMCMEIWGIWVSPGDILFIYLFLVFWGLYPWHMEVPRLGVKLRAVATGLHHSHSKPNLSRIYDIHHSSGNATSLTPERVQGWNPRRHGSSSGLLPLSHNGNSLLSFFASLFLKIISGVSIGLAG